MEKKLELTPRLRTVADLVPKGARLVDVGTDHAYLPVWLLLEGHIPQAVATDLREGPLDRARKTARQYRCTDRMAFRLCDGLSRVGPWEADTVAIAGMGGETIAEILSGASWVKENHLPVILQPMSSQPELRRWLWQNGYTLSEEQIVCEGKTLYTIFLAQSGPDSAPEPMTLAEEWAGRQTPDLVQPLRGVYLQHLLDQTGRALEGMAKARGDRDTRRQQELEQVRQGLLEMKEAWNIWQTQP